MTERAAHDDFRRDVRQWLEQECPPSMRLPVGDPSELVFGGRSQRFPSDDSRRWLEAMSGRGFTAPSWPVEYGGAGLDPARASILREEMKRLGCRAPLVSVHGIGMVGPVLMEHGTAEQRRRFLPPTARGELRWCQGFSEPAVGSDLAAVTTVAHRDGDRFVVTGQKLWTTYATESDWIFVLARTDPTVPKRDGLGFFLVDLGTTGVGVRPVALLSGESEFCEVFFDEVDVPAEYLVGGERDGWTIARSVLAREREMFGQGTGLTAQRLQAPDFAKLAQRYGDPSTLEGLREDPSLRDAVAAVEIELECCRALLRRARSGRGALPHPSVVKYTLSEVMKRQSDLASRVAGARSLGWSGADFEADELASTRDYLFSKAWTIAGGSGEIQLNLIARRVLGLPHLGPEQDR